jgi:hypothetical protein
LISGPDDTAQPTSINLKVSSFLLQVSMRDLQGATVVSFVMAYSWLFVRTAAGNPQMGSLARLH